MPLTRTQKQEIIAEVGAVFKEAETLILVHNKGLTVAEVSELRRRMRAAGVSFRVVKNKLAQRALKDTGFEVASDLFTGPTGLATSKDPVSAAKVVVEFAKTNDRLVIVGGAYANAKLAPKEIEQLSKLPSLDELRGKLIGLLQAPAQRIASVLVAPAGQVARVIGAHSRKQ